MAEIEKTMFREYDVRGLVDKDLTENAAELIGNGFATFLSKRGINKAVVGFDSREYSERIKDAFVKGLVNSGINIVDIGMTLAPILYFSQYHLNIKGGAMITASHNPNGWCGFKLGYDFSSTLLPEGVQEVYNIIKNNEFRNGSGTIEKTDVAEAYKKDVLGRINIKKSLRVVIDAGNGTAGVFAPDILRRAGCEVIEQFCNLDSAFPNHEPNPALKETVEALGKRVKEEGADVGFAFDGDGDRIGAVDEWGNVVWGDKILIPLSRALLEKRPGAKIVFDVKCTAALEEDIKAHGGVPVMWKTGHSYIKQKSKEVDAMLGGECSGHIFFTKDYYGYDDAIFAALKLLEYLSGKKETFSEILATAPQYISSPVIHVDCPDERKYEVVDALTKEFKSEYDKVIDINGARVVFKDGWGLVRASSNEPVVVLAFEAKTQERLNEIKEIFRAKLKKFDEVVKKWKNE